MRAAEAWSPQAVKMINSWIYCCFAGNFILALEGGFSANPYLIWYGIADLISLKFFKTSRPKRMLISITRIISMIASGYNLFSLNDNVHIFQIAFGTIHLIALPIMFVTDKLIYIKISAFIFIISSIFLIMDGQINHSYLIVIAGCAYIASNVSCLLIQQGRASPTPEDLNAGN